MGIQPRVQVGGRHVPRAADLGDVDGHRGAVGWHWCGGAPQRRRKVRHPRGLGWRDAEGHPARQARDRGGGRARRRTLAQVRAGDLSGCAVVPAPPPSAPLCAAGGLRHRALA